MRTVLETQGPWRVIEETLTDGSKVYDVCYRSSTDHRKDGGDLITERIDFYDCATRQEAYDLFNTINATYPACETSVVS